MSLTLAGCQGHANSLVLVPKAGQTSIPIKITIDGRHGTLDVGGAYQVHTNISVLSGPPGALSPNEFLRLKTQSGIEFSLLAIREPPLQAMGYVCTECQAIAHGALQTMLFVQAPRRR